jgi:antitoxin HicB
MKFPVKFTRAEEGGWVITCRDLPEAISQAEDTEDREEVAAGCLQAAIEGRIAHDAGLIPAASATRRGEVMVSIPLETAAKAALYQAMKEAHVSKSELARRLNVDEKEVRRMLDTRHGTKIPRLEQAIRALGRRLEIALA